MERHVSKNIHTVQTDFNWTKRTPNLVGGEGDVGLERVKGEKRLSKHIVQKFQGN